MSSQVDDDVKRRLEVASKQDCYWDERPHKGKLKIRRKGHPGMVPVPTSAPTSRYLKNIERDLHNRLGVDFSELKTGAAPKKHPPTKKQCESAVNGSSTAIAKDTPMTNGIPAVVFGVGAPEPATPSAPSIVDEIIEAPESSWLLCEQVREQAREQAAKRRSYRGFPGWEWRGNLYGDVLRSLWDGLPANPNHPHAIRLAKHLLTPLKEDCYLVLVSEPKGPQIWWVRAAETDAATDDEATPAPAPAAEPHHPESSNTVQLNQCPHCPFQDESEVSLRFHVSHYKDRKHPVERVLECPVTGCQSVRCTAESYANHLKRAPHYRSGFMCKDLDCLLWFKDQGSLNAHRREGHGIVPGRHTGNGAKPPAATVARPTVPPVAVPAPQVRNAVPTGDFDPLAYADQFVAILTEWAEMKRGDTKKDEKIVKLEAELKATKATLKKIKKAMAALGITL